MDNAPDPDSFDLEEPAVHLDLLGPRLGLVGLVFLILYLTACIGSLLPLQLLDPAWQLRLVGSLINNAGFALLGLVLVHLAAALAPECPPLQARRDALARWAILAALGFLLLIPLQGYASWQGASQNSASQGRQLRQAKRKLADLSRAVQGASNGRELQERLRALQGPDVSDADLAQPLPSLKRQLLAAFAEARRRIESQSAQPTTADPSALLQEHLRVAVASLALAVGFASLAQRRGSPLSLLQHWQIGLAHRRPGQRRRQRFADAGYLEEIGPNPAEHSPRE